MPETIQTASSPTTMSLDDMKDRLNDLWTRYLEHLDQYDKAQKELSTHLSSGFFSLAQANFNSSNRTRYGQDYYDERMHASRLASISVDEDGHVESFSMVKAEARSEDAKAEHLDGVEVKQQQQPTPPGTPPVETSSTESKTKDGGAEEAKPEKSAKAEQTVKDPIRWFGVLVPPQLRSCQNSFISAVEGPICEATNAVRAMRAIEVGIRKLRKDIKKAEKGAKEASVAS